MGTGLLQPLLHTCLGPSKEGDLGLWQGESCEVTPTPAASLDVVPFPQDSRLGSAVNPLVTSDRPVRLVGHSSHSLSVDTSLSQSISAVALGAAYCYYEACLDIHIVITVNVQIVSQLYCPCDAE